MTLRELSGCLEMIDVRTHNDFALNANIHGHKVEMKNLQAEVEEITDEQKRIMADIHRDAIKRKMTEKGRSQE
jgi:hypothetical protein